MCSPCKHSFKKSPPDHFFQFVSPDSILQSCFCQTSCQFYKDCQKKMLINLELLRDVRIMCILCVNSVPKREHYNNIKHVRLSIIQICSNIILFKDFWISINKTCRFKDLHTSFTMYCFHFNILQTICIYLIRLLFWSFRMCIKYN